MSARDAANVTDCVSVTLERDPPPKAAVCPKCGSPEVVQESAQKVCKLETCKFRWSSSKD